VGRRVARDQQVLGLEIAVHDAGTVRGGEAVRDLDRVIERQRRWHRAACEPLAQRLALEELEHEVRRTIVLGDIEHGGRRVLERRRRAPSQRTALAIVIGEASTLTATERPSWRSRAR
jgi:hypothetical protein